MNKQPQGFGQGGPQAPWHEDGETPVVTQPEAKGKDKEKEPE